MPKAILITEDNKNALTAQYHLDDEELDDCVGWHLVSDFGAEHFLVTSKLDDIYTRTGEILANDYFEVKMSSAQLATFKNN